MGDFNTDLTSDSFLIKELRKKGIIDIMEDRIGYDRAINTRNPGSKPIDGIFASNSLDVVRCGYDAGDTLMSDHTFIWAQFAWDSLLGLQRSKACPPKERRLQIKYEKVMLHFNAMLEEVIERHRLLQKAETLEKEILQGQPLSKAQEAQYEQINHQFARIVAGCEKKCRKLYPNDIEFSPSVKTAIASIAICKELKRRLLINKKVSSRLIMEMKKRWRIEKYFAVPATLEEAKHNLNKAWEEFRVVKEQAPELREHFIESLIEAAEEEGDEEQVKKLTNIQNRERSALSHDRIKFARGKMRNNTSVRYIEKDTDNGRIPIRNKKDTITGIMETNSTKLHQCNEGQTPLRSQPLQSLLSKHDYDVWESFLRGEIDIPEGLDRGTSVF